MEEVYFSGIFLFSHAVYFTCIFVNVFFDFCEVMEKENNIKIFFFT